jgi:hypothetical protein
MGVLLKVMDVPVRCFHTLICFGCPFSPAFFTLLLWMSQFLPSWLLHRQQAKLSALCIAQANGFFFQLDEFRLPTIRIKCSAKKAWNTQ